jgi:hypothetical protein
VTAIAHFGGQRGGRGFGIVGEHFLFAPIGYHAIVQDASSSLRLMRAILKVVSSECCISPVCVAAGRASFPCMASSGKAAADGALFLLRDELRWHMLCNPRIR